MGKVNYLKDIRAKVLSLVAKNISLNDEDSNKRYKTLLRLTNSQIALIMERIFDEEDFYNLIDILESLDGHPNSRKLMEYILYFDGELLTILKQLVCNTTFAYSDKNVKILSGLCGLSTDDNELVLILTKLNELFEIFNQNIGNLDFDTNGFISFITETILSNKNVLNGLNKIEKQMKIQLQNIELIRKIKYSTK